MIIDMMKYSAVLLFLIPTLSFAQADTTGSLQALLTGIGGFLNGVVIPFILAIAFIVFVVNVVRFFVIGGASDEGQKNAKNLAIYGIGAFVFILSFWGIVNLLVAGVGLENESCAEVSISDYIRQSIGDDPCETDDQIPRRSRPDPDPEPDPDPIINPGDPEEIIAEAASTTKSTLAANPGYFQRLFGAYQNAIQRGLFADLIIAQEATQAQQARAIARTAAMGIISQAIYERYLQAYEAEQIARGILNPDRRENIEASLPVPPPTRVANPIEETQDAIRRQLDLYQTRVDGGGFAPPLSIPGTSGPATPAQVITYLFNQSIAGAVRENYFITLLTIPHDIIDASLSEQLYNQYVDANNALAVYSAQMSNLVESRDPRFAGPR